MDATTAVVLGLAVLLVLLLIYVLHLRSTVELRVKRRMAEREQEFEDRVERERQEALESSRAVLKGKVGEQVAPLLSDFPFNPSDARFVGSPVDYVVFDGYTDVKDGDGSEVEMVMMDVKTGNSRLTREQRAIREAVEDGRVEWVTLRV